VSTAAVQKQESAPPIESESESTSVHSDQFKVTDLSNQKFRFKLPRTDFGQLESKFSFFSKGRNQEDGEKVPQSKANTQVELAQEAKEQLEFCGEEFLS
jgi:hypothetical protein